MATYEKFNATVADVWNGVHNISSDQLVVALSDIIPTSSNSVLADITQISYTNLSSRNITTISSSQAGGLYSSVLAPLTLTASGGPVAQFQYVSIYNDDSVSDSLLFWADVGSSVNLTDGQTFQITFGIPAFTMGP